MIEAKNQITIYKNIKNLNNLLKIKIIINQDNISEDFSFKYIIKLQFYNEEYRNYFSNMTIFYSDEKYQQVINYYI